ncbi:sigma-54 dependent transcriptional regulator [Novosphingobium sp. 9U]|uniref:sigma-54-dependent transcriptional regulator n=1 Tax=Novosphingobium sp. 9U TaxID=2653158 RepID=UPI0012F1F4E5|nr:sigma-54 dependent transcriptional regulator [Novosphingobium sp. 9U]VWX54064.1 Sigma-54-dependent Fis family transcriptional regulator [Novosphingobium sp. 9U]
MVPLDVVERLVVLIGSEQSEVRRVTSSVSKFGWRVACAPDHVQALALLDSLQGAGAAAAILDGWSAAPDEREAFSELRRHHPGLPILLLTSSGDASHAIDAMRIGATDYLIKPFAPDRLLGALRRVTSGPKALGELQPLSAKFDIPAHFEGMVGTDTQFRATLARAAMAARGCGHVLAEGESGTGKTMLLRALHAASPRSNAPFKILNMRSYSENSLRSVLFGHEKGAFPGAFSKQVGTLQSCHGGTLLLQEVNRMPLAVQQELAASIEQNKVRPLGAGHSFVMDVRLLTTSNQPLSELTETGRFDPALQKALNATWLHMPPLRSRIGDIPALARSFLARVQDHASSRKLTINEDAYDVLRSYEWPSNIRQLQSILLKAMATCGGAALTASHLTALAEVAVPELPQELRRRVPEQTGVQIFEEDGHVRRLEQIEADVIRLAIGHYQGRLTEIARRLGIGRSTLYRKLDGIGIHTFPEQGRG